MEKKYNIYFYCFLSFITAIIIFLSLYICKYVIYFGDDVWQGMYEPDEKIFDSLYKKSFLFIPSGGYFVFFITRFLNFGLPNLLGIHPSDFMSQGFSIIKALIIISVFLLYTVISNSFVKSRKYFLCIYFFIATVFFWLIYYVSSEVFLINHFFIRYVFCLLFFIIFWQFIYKNITSVYSKNNPLLLLFVIFSGAVIAVDLEIYMYTTVLLSVLLIFYNIFSNLINKIFNKNITLFNLKKEFFIPIIFFYIILFVYNISPGYKTILNVRGLNDFQYNLHYFSEFLTKFIDLYILKFGFIFFIILVIILEIFSFKYSYKKNEINKIIFPFLLQISSIIVYLSLALLGKSFYNNNDFWISSTKLLFIYYFLFLYTFLIFFSYCINEIKNKIKSEYNKNIFLNYVCIALIFSSYIFNIYSIPKIRVIGLDWTLQKVKKRLYVSEKILRFYYLKNQVPYLPAQFNDNANNNSASLYLWNERFEDFKTNPCKVHSDIKFTDSYYVRIYKTDIPLKLGYCFSDDALDKYYSNGGVFSKNELKKLKFSNLLNEKFIFDNELEKYKIVHPEDILE